MKRFNVLILAVLLLLPITMLSGCKQNISSDKISVVCTVFPQYDWVSQIIDDNTGNVELTFLLDKKIDLHSYQPSVEDIASVSACDLLIYVGGESEGWVDNVLKEATNKNMVVINLIDELGTAAKEEDIKEGMEAENEEGEDKNAYDEHVWLSLKNAKVFCTAITDALSSLDTDNSEIYKSNLTAYIEKLSALDSEYQTVVNTAPIKALLFGDRFPFRYLVDDYGLDYYAAFAGCSTETEAGFDTVIFLAGKADELNLNSILVTESSDQSIAKTIRDNSKNKDRQIFVLNAMQSVTSGEVKAGTTYIGVMESNLNVLKDALK